MARRELLFSLKDKLKRLNIGMILIQINEAHTTKWKIGKEYCPKVQEDYDDRVKRANEFVQEYDVPYPVYIDGWEDTYDNNYRSWPDKYYYVEVNTKQVIKKSEYHMTGSKLAIVKEDYARLLRDL